jgi:oxygen tolerance protein BatD
VRSLMMMLLCVLVARTPVAAAQDTGISIDAELSRTRAYLGDTVSYQVSVRGIKDGTEPSIAFPEGVVVEYRGVSSQQFTTMRSINGRQRAHTDSSYRHNYLLTVVQEGELVIPPAVLNINNQEYRSNSVRLSAMLPAESLTDVLEVRLPDRAVYVGESVLAQVTWWVGDQTRDLNFESSVFPDSMQVVPMSPSSRSGQEIQMSLAGQRFSAFAENGIYQGASRTRLRFDVMLTPTEAGVVPFGPMRVIFTRVDDFGRAQRKFAESAVVDMRVVAVPGAGRPDGYQGLIGEFRAQTDASNTQVNVGDPIEFRLLVSGPDPMIGLEKTLDAQSLAKSGFRVSPEGWREVERNRSGERLFSTTIRATDDSVTEIPAIQLPAFNPETGAFEVFSSNPIPLEVRSVRTVTLSDAVVSGGVTDSGGTVERTELARNPSVLWTHPDVEAFQGSAKAFSWRGVFADPVWVGVVGLTFAAPLLCWGAVAIQRRRDPEAAAVDRAWKVAKKMHNRGDHIGAIRAYGGAILGIDPDSLTGADLKKLSVTPDVAARSAAVLTESESKHYGTLHEVRDDASLLRAMRRDILKHDRLRHDRGRTVARGARRIQR